MTASLVVRKFRATEWSTYRDLRLRALAESPDAFGRTFAEEKDRPDEEWSSRLAEWLGTRNCYSILAIADEKPAGLLFARFESAEQDSVRLYSMWVDPMARRHGTGRRLVESVQDWSREHGAKRILLHVTLNNAAAIGLYERCGFRLTAERIPLREGSPLFATGMELEL
jgi:ribosomal protein S18 acetylase RimI-like enzyme